MLLFCSPSFLLFFSASFLFSAFLLRLFPLSFFSSVCLLFLSPRRILSVATFFAYSRHLSFQQGARRIAVRIVCYSTGGSPTVRPKNDQHPCCRFIKWQPEPGMGEDPTECSFRRKCLHYRHSFGRFTGELSLLNCLEPGAERKFAPEMPRPSSLNCQDSQFSC